MYHYLFELMACDTYLNNSFISIKDPVSENYDAMDTTRAKHQLMFSIMENAISQGYFVENVETHDLELLNCMENVHDSLPIIEKLPLKNTVFGDSYLYQSSLVMMKNLKEERS